MQIQIEHQTHYTYEKPVHLEPHTFRLRPRADGTQLLQAFDMTIDPQPAALTQSLDASGNAVVRAWFDKPTEHLRIDTKATVELTRTNPFDFSLEKSWAKLPMQYPPALAAALSSNMRSAADNESDRILTQEAHRLAQEANYNTMDFLVLLTHWLNERNVLDYRHTGQPYLPLQTFQSQRGACRDVAVLHMTMCRLMGLAARFVSGYEQGDPNAQQDLHAWVEVYLPGAGWRGFDPSRGIATGIRHVALAAAAHPLAASPVTGSFTGPILTPELVTTVRVVAISETQDDTAFETMLANQKQQQQQQQS